MLIEQQISDRESIVLSIVKKRNEMLTLAEKNGLSSNKTIACSQELDALLNRLDKLELSNSKYANQYKNSESA
ncbi:aspartyl-phosphate phosphatase Spo0E family protein [Oceanobacillus damuensis]|uniref:aspartyl-phosphate phosphatase Spo0E family protein n=1 Tax=Oceanobacillus damuensis TaxID=937928 RepID=UPI00082EABD0|nr:aspartyl-phosphate phosphatase Spo0E family protein [Oceanobacillus damuensis]